MTCRLSLVALLVWTSLVSAQDKVVHQGTGFTIVYPRKSSELQPASATVPFQIVYRKNSLLRLETERLTRPIDLNDASFAQIFLEIQRGQLNDRITVPIESERVRRFPWGIGIEFVYHLPARSGNQRRPVRARAFRRRSRSENKRDRVSEIVTTVEKTLYRFTHWIPEKDLKRVAEPFSELVQSFRPETRVAEVSLRPDASASADQFSYSVKRTEETLGVYRRQIAEAVPDNQVLADLQAALAKRLGWKAYLAEVVLPEELAEMRHAADAAWKATPGDVDAHQARAWVAYHENHMVEMEKEIKAALRVEPDNAQNHLLYALWYGFSPERAEALARQAVEADPELVPAYYIKARADRRAGDLAEATNSLEDAIRIDPGFVEARMELADILRESGDVEAALVASRAAVTSAPDHVSARFRYAVALRRTGRIDEAIAEYENSLHLDEALAEAHYNLAVLYLKEKQQPGMATQHFRHFIELEPTSDRASRVLEWLRSNASR